jgi:hypothetical protein
VNSFLNIAGPSWPPAPGNDQKHEGETILNIAPKSHSSPQTTQCENSFGNIYSTMTSIPGYGQRRAGQTIFKYCPIATSPGIELIREFILKYCSITAISIKTKPLLNIDPSSPPPPETTHYVNSFLNF